MPPSQNQFLFKDKASGVALWIKRLDLQFPHGNKHYKLKYNLEAAKAEGRDTLLSFGGAFSNHIAAIAEEGKRLGFKTIGIIRGEELGKDFVSTLRSNPTLDRAVQNGMQLYFVSRESYRNKDSAAFGNRLAAEFGKVYILPEGGTNALAIKGCEEILEDADKSFDFVCCPVGTGGTLAGIINSSAEGQQVLGYSALNANFDEKIGQLVEKRNWRVFREVDFYGFAKINPELVSFINRFSREYAILLDPLYTAKMMSALTKGIKNGAFAKNSRLLAIHTGGLQGIAGMNLKLAKKGWPLINPRPL